MQIATTIHGYYENCRSFPNFTTLPNSQQFIKEIKNQYEWQS